MLVARKDRQWSAKHFLQINSRCNDSLLSVDRQGEILSHDTILINSINAALFQILSESSELIVSVQFSTEDQATCPCEDGSDGVGRGFTSLLVLPVVTGDCAVGGFGFADLSVGSVKSDKKK